MSALSHATLSCFKILHAPLLGLPVLFRQLPTVASMHVPKSLTRSDVLNAKGVCGVL